MRSLQASSFIGEISNYGNMFELVALQNVIIRAFDVHCISTENYKIEVYKKPGELGAYRAPGAWTEISNDNTFVDGQGTYMHVYF